MLAEKQLGGTGGGGIVFQIDRHVAKCRQFGLEIARAPQVHFRARGPGLFGPVPELEGGGNAEPGHAVAQFFRQ